MHCIPATRISPLQLECRSAPDRSRTTMPNCTATLGARGWRFSSSIVSLPLVRFSDRRCPPGPGHFEGGVHAAQKATASTRDQLAQIREGWRAQSRTRAFGRGVLGGLTFDGRSGVEHDPQKLVVSRFVSENTRRCTTSCPGRRRVEVHRHIPKYSLSFAVVRSS